MSKQNIEQWFTAALEAHRAGNLDKARELYERVLQTQSKHVDALSLLGTVFFQSGRLQEAVTHLQRTIALQADHPVAHANLGLTYHDLGELDAAERHYREARRLDPNSVQVASNLACLLRERGRQDAAEAAFGQLLARHPDYAPGHYNLGLLRREQGDLQAAAACYRRALELDPRYAEAHYNLGNVLRELEQYDAAIQCYQRALSLRPNFAEAMCNLGVVYFKQGKQREAADLCLAAVKLKPNYADAYCNLGTIFGALGDKKSSLEYYRQATALNPQYAEAFSNLANAYQDVGDFAAALEASEKAIAANPKFRGGFINKAITLMKLERHDEAEGFLRKALELNPNDADALGNLGSVYTYRLQPGEALACYEKALASEPDNPLAHWNRGWILLSRGNLDEGWREYEWGLKTRERRITQCYPHPYWRGEVLRGKTILVYAEQGVGDEVLFASCLPDLLRSRARCILQCDPRLVSLFQRSFPQLVVHGGPRDEDIGWLQEFGQVDYQVPIGSLPVHFRKDLKAFEDRPPYLVPDSAHQQRWRERLAGLGQGLKVGIGWRSRLHSALRGRYYPNVEHLWPLLKVPGVVFVNLQYDHCAEELARAHRETGVQVHVFEDLDLFNDLDGCVALMSALDLVIAPATTSFNLSAACGAPTWLFYAKSVDAWRLGSRMFPWYQNARLFEQEQLWDWDTVSTQMAAELQILAARHRPSAGMAASAPAKRPVASAAPRSHVRDLCTRALELHQQQSFDQAEALYREALSQLPDDVEALALLGTLLGQTGKVQEARRTLERAQQLQPDNVQILVNLGFVCQQAGDHTAELACYEQAIGVDSRFLPAYESLVNALLERGQYARGLEISERWLQRDPRAVEAHYRKGMALLRLEDRRGAEQAWLRVLELNPSHPKAHNELGVLDYNAGKVAEAESRYRRAVALQPDFREAHVNLGGVLTRTGRYQEAVSHYDAVLAREHDYAPAHHNRGMVLLALGQLREGWREWAWRLRVETGSAFSTLMNAAPLWKGEPLAGKTLLVHGEQGVGDELLFGTCLADVVKMGGRVILQCDPRLAGLFQRAFPTIEVHGGARNQTPAWLASAGKFDYQCPSGELPALLRPDLSAFSSQTGYLVADPQRRKVWRDRLAALGGGLKVGIAWRGHLREALREPSYTQLSKWRELLSLPGVHFINLQHGLEPAEREQLNGRVICFDDLDLFDDFEDSAALMSELDLVISVEMATYNVAGALGVPTWLVSAHVPKRGWVMLGTDKIPWYPSVRVFRQPRFGEWSEVFQRIAAALAERVAQCGTRENVSAQEASPWPNVIAPLLRAGARACIVGNVESPLITAMQQAVGENGRVDVYPAVLEAGRIPEASAACDLVVLGADADAVPALVAFSKLISRFKPLMLFSAISDRASGALAALGYATTSLAVLLRRESAPNVWCAFPTVAHTREKPSAKYQELLSYYRNMHAQGYTRVVNGESVYTAAADAFPGNELPNYVRPVRALIRGTGARTILDYGAGKGMQYTWPIDVDGTHFQSVQQFWGVDRIEMYEPALPGRDRLPSQSLDAVVCTDVLEHVPESDIPWIVDEMFSFARRFVFASVACYPAMARLPSGENAHCTVRSPAWWEGLLKMTAARHPGVQYLVVAEEVNAGGAGLVPRWLSNFSLSGAG